MVNCQQSVYRMSWGKAVSFLLGVKERVWPRHPLAPRMPQLATNEDERREMAWTIDQRKEENTELTMLLTTTQMQLQSLDADSKDKTAAVAARVRQAEQHRCAFVRPLARLVVAAVPSLLLLPLPPPP